MPRPVSLGRATPQNRGDEVRYIISQDAETVNVYAKVGDGIEGEKIRTLIATFEGHIAWERVSGRELQRQGQGGTATPVAEFLLAEYPTDRYGRAVIINAGNEVVIRGTSYTCTMPVPFKYKIEATLELRT